MSNLSPSFASTALRVSKCSCTPTKYAGSCAEVSCARTHLPAASRSCWKVSWVIRCIACSRLQPSTCTHWSRIVGNGAQVELALHQAEQRVAVEVAGVDTHPLGVHRPDLGEPADRTSNRL